MRDDYMKKPREKALCYFSIVAIKHHDQGKKEGFVRGCQSQRDGSLWLSWHEVCLQAGRHGAGAAAGSSRQDLHTGKLRHGFPILPKQFSQLGTKYANLWAYGGRGHSSHQTEQWLRSKWSQEMPKSIGKQPEARERWGDIPGRFQTKDRLYQYLHFDLSLTEL